MRNSSTGKQQTNLLKENRAKLKLIIDHAVTESQAAVEKQVIKLNDSQNNIVQKR